MNWSMGPRLRSWRARRQGWDPDIVRAVRLAVPRSAQDRARELIQQRNWEAAINEIRSATGYDRRDARCVALALMYAWKIPTSPSPHPQHRPTA